MRKFLHEPLVQFLFLGAILFGAYTLLPDEQTLRSDSVIEISEGDVDWLIAAWSRQWRRSPTESELRGLIDSRVREEVLYREAIAMGLDRDDEIVRRRLAQKMEFLAEDLALMAEPTDSALRDFFTVEADRYRLPEERAFGHVYFRIDERGSLASEAATATLATLQATEASIEQAGPLGDRFLLPADYTLRSEERVSRDFGPEFAAAVFSAEPGMWIGPVESPYGVHLVLVTERVVGTMPPYEELQGRVHTDFNTLRREEANEAVFQALLARYDVQVDEDAIQVRLNAGEGDGR